MNIFNLLLSGSEYFFLNKHLVKKIGINSTLILAELININQLNEKEEYCTIKLIEVSNNTTLSIFKIKNGLNSLYKKKFIDVIVKNNDTIDVKIYKQNIISTILTDLQSFEIDTKKSKKKSIIKQRRFKKPTVKELKEYFIEIGNNNESHIMYDYYESKGWKVGKAPMKCWKSAARNWIRRLNKQKTFPDYYDKKIELKLSNDVESLTKYHQHLKQLGWISSYSPSAGMTWRKK
ncbi:MAG: hypothetical protein CMP49_06490 [Flavobacteriales bacterium]|jgi:hypothetical protein|nr:hypothetical protein [Flavobacteriales bacterium]|tara:strand:+ start:22207 stop:22908 length:702 start_codon:yes stop_codon:yes gene_type:complete